MIPRSVLKAFLVTLFREQWHLMALAAFDVALYSALGFAAYRLWADAAVPLWVRVVITVVLADGWKTMAGGWVKGALLMRDMNRSYPFR